MTQRTKIHSLQVATELFDFINHRVLPGTGVSSDTFWQALESRRDVRPDNVCCCNAKSNLQMFVIRDTN